MTGTRGTQRIDKWLWFARFFKTRGLAAKVASGGHCRVNGTHVAKASYGIAVGDVLTFVQARQVRVVEVVDLGTRRGPAPEAQTLYIDRSPPPVTAAPKAPGSDREGRPTKQDRRAIERLRRKDGPI